MVNSKLYHSAKKLVLYYYYYICFLSGLYTRFKESGAGTILILYILEEREEILVDRKKVTDKIPSNQIMVKFRDFCYRLCLH